MRRYEQSQQSLSDVDANEHTSEVNGLLKKSRKLKDSQNLMKSKHNISKSAGYKAAIRGVYSVKCLHQKVPNIFFV